MSGISTYKKPTFRASGAVRPTLRNNWREVRVEGDSRRDMPVKEQGGAAEQGDEADEAR
jgi:hypothetical protein